MNKKIWKYQVTSPLEDLELPEGAEFLSIQNQLGQNKMWWLVDPDAPLMRRKLRVFGTGHNVTGDNLKFLGTFQEDGGYYIFHLFEELA